MRHDGHVIVVAAEHLLQPLGPFHRLQFGADTDRRQLRLDDFATAPCIGRRRQLEVHVETVRIAGLGQQCPRAIRIVRIAVAEIDIGRVVRREMAADRRAEPEHRAIDDLLTVDGVGDRLAHPDVAERFAAQVDAHDRLAFGGADDDFESVIVLEPCQSLRSAHIGDRVDVSGQQGRHLGGGIGDEAERHAAQSDRVRIAEVGVARQLHAVALDPAIELERAGADRMGLVAVGAFRPNDRGVAGSHIEQEQPV